MDFDIVYLDTEAYVDLAICTYARVLQKLHEMRITSPGTEADSKFYKIMEDCMTFRTRLDIAQYIAPGAPCDRLQPPSLPACQSDKTDGIPPTSPPSPPFSPPSPTCSNCAIVQKLEPTSHPITPICADLLGCPRYVLELFGASLVFDPGKLLSYLSGGVAVFPFDPGERVSYLTGGVRSSFPFDPGG